MCAAETGRRSSRVLPSQDKGSIVIDIGALYTKCGMSGEPAPRHIFRSQAVMKPYGQLQDVWDPTYINREELYLILCLFLQKVYFKLLMVNPKDYRVVVVESIVCPTHFRNTLARALFSSFNVPYACFVPSHLLSLFTIARQSALVVDVGFKESTILPVYEGIPIVTAWQSTGCAAKAVLNSLKALLVERATVRCRETGEEKPLGELAAEDTFEASLEDIMVRTCFVRPYESESRLPPDVEYPLSNKHILVVDGHVRVHAADVLFKDDDDDLPLPVCILEALHKSASDCRRELSGNIMVTGGIASLPGFNNRLQSELRALVSSPAHRRHYLSLSALQFAFHSPPSHSNCTSWLGGSIFGSSETAVLERSVSRDYFKEHRKLPDWTSADPDDWERLRAIPTRKLLPSSPSSFTTRQLSSGRSS